MTMEKMTAMTARGMTIPSAIAIAVELFMDPEPGCAVGASDPSVVLVVLELVPAVGPKWPICEVVVGGPSREAPELGTSEDIDAEGKGVD